MKKFFSFLSGNRLVFLVTLFVGIFYCANSVILPTMAGNLINAVTGNMTDAAGIIALYLGAYLLQLFLSQSDTYLSAKFKIRQRALMRRNTYASCASGFTGFRSHTTGSFGGDSLQNRESLSAIVSFLNNDLPAVVEQYFAGTIDIIKCVCLILFSAVSLFSVHWLLAVEILGFSILIVCVPNFFKRKGNQARSKVAEAMAQYNLQIQSFLAGFPVLKAYGYRERSMKFSEISNMQIAHEESGQLRYRVMVYGATAFFQLSRDAVILISSVLLIARGEMSVGHLVTVLQLASLLASPVEVLASLRHSRNEVRSLLEKYEDILDGNGQKEFQICKEDRNFLTDNQKKVQIDLPEDESLKELRLRNVSCVADGNRILNSISYTFCAGEKYLITGKSGSGKSTLLRCLARMAETREEGEVLFNGKKDDKIPDAVYYKHICPVFQEPYLFYATIEENILLGRDIPDSIYREAIRKLNLEYLLERYAGREISPDMLEQLSGGEKQRIALARAMVGRPEAYLLDEVTSALDKKNAEDVERMFLEEDAMVIFVSHKPAESLRGRYTQQLVMEQGKLVCS